MTDRTAVPERVTQRAKTARRGGGSGPQAVGDYVGQPAGEAAQAVRRGGLRPGLDRSFGCPAELTGLVVAQDPAAGSGLARNGMVTLYVAAPGGEPLDGDAELAPAASGASEGELRAPEPPDESLSTKPVPARPRRRKRGLAQRPPTAVEPPPAPTMPGESASERVPAQAPWSRWANGRAEIDAPVGALEDEPTVELDEREVPHDDEFVVQVEDVLAGRSGPPALARGLSATASSDARTPGPGSRARMARRAPDARWRHRRGAGAVDARRRHLRDGRPSPAHAAGQRARAESRADGEPSPPGDQAASSAKAGAAQDAGAIPAPAHRSASGAARCAISASVSTCTAACAPVAPAVREAACPQRHRGRASPAPQPSAAAPPRASAPPAPAPEQSGGGLFSP